MNDLKVTLVQTDIAWENISQNLNHLSESLKNISTTDLVVLPEMFSTGFSMHPEKFAETMEGSAVIWMKKMAAEKNCTICGSLMIEENGKYFNRFVLVESNGTIHQYNKKHLFGLGDETNHYTAGTEKIIVELNGWKILPLICYDLRFPVWSRNKLINDKAEYDLLLYVANWPAKRKQAWQTLLPARAIENQCYVVGVNRVGVDGNQFDYSGNSMAIDCLGNILFQNEGQQITETISLNANHLLENREVIPFLKDADKFSFS